LLFDWLCKLALQQTLSNCSAYEELAIMNVALLRLRFRFVDEKLYFSVVWKKFYLKGKFNKDLMMRLKSYFEIYQTIQMIVFFSAASHNEQRFDQILESLTRNFVLQLSLGY
jgi:hypothetical protein